MAYVELVDRPFGEAEDVVEATEAGEE
jgi:hypothetical protein